ncbi:alanyl-tRNA synthetase [Mycoplasma feriruminatoris]|uniref:Alanine--tRNA ligase n=1 Tax=Mycoplasma feriruminatoris TaxID=1179777 RepID=A0A654ILN9_9MOLU|nr:alanine--tRNA ligase [Mycoplasma feriruminatoris]WFQ96254.1 alanyl-tRNA synthetase [Mycoplasma feriruminatoris]VZR98388.1 Alanine--tRNA ligase [Mycoplasma feriruminatoris]
MKKLSTNQIRRIWLDFFISKNHYFLETVSLIPVDDPSLLWINSGVATLKPYFDGRKTPPSPRLTNSQKAIRTNDIENVGITARHHTMFEMLGNFSIGDYFKKEAIEFAWELLTDKKYFDIDKNKLYITVFNEDDEAYKIWKEVIKIEDDHIFRLSRKTNFWDVGQGPCGPNTEIFYDRGEIWDPNKIGPRLISDDIENDRYIEVWNIVFSQFNNDGNNNYTELPRKNIDTGAGLERFASIFQNTPTNFETDIFYPTIKKVEQLTNDNFKYSIDNYFNPNQKQTRINTAFKVIADHIRATVFAISDGVFPGNKDRGYIIRRLIRRSCVFGKELGINQAFLYKLVDSVIESMKEFYPYLIDKKSLVEQTIKTEEEKFLKTLSKGYDLLENIIKTKHQVVAKDALLLFESYGFPIEQTIEISELSNVKVDVKGFEELLEQTKQATRNARKDLKAWDKQNELFTKLNVESEFTGWSETSRNDAKVIYMFTDQKQITTATDQEVFIILDKTPFYAEKGGQAADTGLIFNNNAKGFVVDVQQGPTHQNIHRVQLQGTLKVNDLVDCRVDEEKRIYTMKNHSGTHMIHYALREVLGNSVMQSGSYNDENGLRMDFTFNRLPSSEELLKAQNLVLEKIKQKVDRQTYFCSLAESVNKYHALAFFTEKYDEIVRVIKFGDFSSELCGGTHVNNTSEIEDFIITGIESKGSGVYRIKCLTSFKTVNEYLNEQFKLYKDQAEVIIDKYNQNKNLLTNELLENTYLQIKNITINKQNLLVIKDLLDKLKEINKDYDKKVNDLITANKLLQFKDLTPSLNKDNVNEIRLETTGLNIKDLKQLADDLRNKFNDLIVILLSSTDENNFIVVAVSQSLQDKYKAIDIFNNLEGYETKGGGNANLAQGKFVKK